MDTPCEQCLMRLVQLLPWRAALVEDGTIRAVNAGFLDFFRAEEAEIIGKKPNDVLTLPLLSGMLAAALSSNRTMRTEGAALVRGRERALLAHIIPVESGAGSLLTVADLTAQREAQAGMAYRLAGGTGADDFWVFDSEHNLVFTNATHLADVPLPPSRDLLSLLTPESRDLAERNFAWALAHPGETVAGTYRVMRSGGKTADITVDGSFRYDSEYGGHYFCVLRSSTLQGAGILHRLQRAYEVRTDAALAKKLRASPARVSAVRQGNMPVAGDWLWRAFEDTRVSMDWIATGRGEMRRVG